jgi:hypothetical protein
MAQIKKISTELQPLDKLLDTSGDAGTSGQILSSTGSGTNWIAAGGSGTVTGSGTIGYIPKWTTTTALGNSVLQNDSSLPNDLIMPQYIRHSGDTNTYFGFYSNDTFIVATSNNEVMRVTSAGNVGIGTASPNARLEILSDGSAAAGAEIRLQHANNNTNDVVSTVNFANNAGSVAMIQSGTTGANNTGYISFFTDNAGTSAEKMRILGDGNVGIGASNPLRKLHVVGNMAVNAGTGEYYGILMTGGESADPTITIGDWHNSSATIKWDSTGNYLRIDSQHSTANAPIVFSGNDATTEYMRINSSGNIGIGTNSPDNKLDVVVTDVNITPNAESSAVFRRNGNNYISILSNSSNWGGILFGEETDANDGALTYNHPSGYMVFEIRDAERMRINSSGNVGIGTTAPNEALEVSGNIRASGSYKVGATEVISSGRRFYSADGSAASPAYSFSGFTDDGMYREVYGTTKSTISFATEGTRRGRIGEFGIWSDANVYATNQFRMFGTWQATNGTTGGGFTFLNTADNSSAVLLSITSVASAATDSVATFSGKVVSAQTASSDGNGVLTTKSYVDGLVTGVTRYMGLWDASSGTGGNPDLTASTYKVPGYYFIVSVAGDAEPNGAGTEPDTWHVGDWVIWSDQATDAWQKIDNTSVLSGTGTANKLALWNGDESLTNSRFSQNATTNIITGPGNAASDKSLSVTSGAGTEQLYIQGTGEVVVTQNYFYVSASQGAYINGILRARGGVTDDGGTLGLGGNGAVDNLVLTSNTSATFAGRILNTYTGTSTHQLKNGTSNGTILELITSGDGRTMYFQSDHIWSNGSFYLGNNSYNTIFRGNTYSFENGNATFAGQIDVNGAVSTFGAAGTGTGDAVVSIDGGSGTGGEAYLRLTRGGTSGFILNHTASAIQVRATANIPMYFYTNDTVALTLNTSQNATFAGDVVANGTIQTLASNANLTISGDTSGSIYYNNTAGEHRWRANGSSVNSMTLSSSLLTVNENATFTGNVGIGITSPSEKLEVGGPIVWNGSLIASQTSSGVLDRSGDNIRIRAYGASAGSGVLQIRTGGGGDNVDTLALTIDSSQNATFAGDISIPVAKKLYFGGGSHTYIGEDIDDRLRFFVGGAEFLRFTEDTADTIFICQNAKPLSDSTIDLGSTSLRYANIWVDNINGATPAVGANYLPLAGGTMTGSIDFGTNNRDISMTDSAGALTRVMVLNTSNTMYIGPVDTYAGGSIIYGAAAGVSYQRWYTGASERMRITTSGNVGIGTTVPSQKLHISGNMRLTGAFRDRLNSQGAANYVLTSTGSNGTEWVDASGSSIIGGPYLPLAGGTMTGSVIFNDSVQALFGTGSDLKVYHNSADSYIENLTGELRIISNDWALRSATAQIIGYDTTDDYVKFNKDARWVDNEKAQFGTTSDLEIYHDGSNSYINDSGTGNLRIGGTQIDILNPDSNEFKARFLTDGAVELYHNNSKKFETTSTGISVTGVVADRDIPCLFNSNFLDGTASSLYVVPFNNNTETTISAKTYYHYVTIPYAGKLTRVTFKSVSGTPSTSSFTVQLFLYVNGTQQASSSEISWSSVNGITWSPTSSNTFSAGDEINIAYQKSASSRTMAGVAVGVAIELTDYDI